MRRIAIFQLPFRGRREEFLPLRGDPGLQAEWVRPGDFASKFPHGADMIILPGSKTTVSDLDCLRESGGATTIFRHLANGGTVVGICAGFQILGNMLHDPLLRQGNKLSTPGLGLMPIQTLFGPEMISVNTKGRCLVAHAGDDLIGGQEHRSGYSWNDSNAGNYVQLNRVDERKLRTQKPLPEPRSDLLEGITWAPGKEPMDGFVSADRRVWGTYIHLIFHYSAFCRAVFQPV